MNDLDIQKIVAGLMPTIKRIESEIDEDIKKFKSDLLPVVERVVRETVERSRRAQGSWGRTGRPAGSKNWGYLDRAMVVYTNAKAAPVCRWDYPRDDNWGRGFARAGEMDLLVPVSPPAYATVQGREYFAHVNAPWRHSVQPFCFHDLAIARAVTSGHATPRQLTKDAAGRDQMVAVLKYADACARFRAFENFGLAEVDADCTEGHSGKFKPRWYKPTEKLLDLMIML